MKTYYRPDIRVKDINASTFMQTLSFVPDEETDHMESKQRSGSDKFYTPLTDGDNDW